MNVNELTALWLRHKEREGNATTTVQHYGDRIKRFTKAFGERNIKDIEREEVLEHIHTANQGIADGTKRANIIAIEQLMRFAKKFRHMKRRWFKDGDVVKPRTGRRERYATPEETQVLIAGMRKDSHLIYRTLRLTGARPGELCKAQISELEGPPGARMIVLTQHKTARKTGRRREIILSPAAEELVMQAIGDRTEGPIFLTVRRKAWIRDRLSRTFRQSRNAAGIDRRVVLYCSRHEAATEIVRSVGIAQAAGILGHSDIKTTQRYTHLAIEDLRAAAAKAIRDVILMVPPDNGNRGDKDVGLESTPVGRSHQGDEAGRRAA